MSDPLTDPMAEPFPRNRTNYLTLAATALDHAMTRGGRLAAVTVSVGGLELAGRLRLADAQHRGDATAVQSADDLTAMSDQELGALVRGLLDHAKDAWT